MSNKNPQINHIWIIMDGNRRWAKKRLLPSVMWHRAGFKNIQKLLPIAIKYNISHLACWVHARRYFIKVLDTGNNPNAQKMVGLIGKLYVIEKQVKKLQPDEKHNQRQANSLPVIKGIKEFLASRA